MEVVVTSEVIDDDAHRRAPGASTTGFALRRVAVALLTPLRATVTRARAFARALQEGSASFLFAWRVGESPEQQPLGRSLVAALRLVLATACLLITAIDPTEPDRFVALTYGVLGAYVIYSGAIYVGSRSSHRFERLFTVTHWIDVAWYTVLVALSSGTGSLFFSGYLFAVLVAAFRFGFQAGLKVTLVSAVLFAGAGLLTAQAERPFELNRYVLRSVYLLVLGYLMASFGHFEVTLRRRLQLLRDAAAMYNPRFGVDYTIGHILQRMREFYDADQCVMVTREGAHELMYRADRWRAHGAVETRQIPPELAERLLALPSRTAVVFRDVVRWGRHRCSIETRMPLGGPSGNVSTETCQALAALFEASDVLTIPVVHHEQYVGRLFVASQGRRFAASDIDLLLQVFQQVTPMLDNIRLVDRLASQAAERERSRIAHDIHDSLIQPLVGVQMALLAVQARVSAGVPLSTELQQLTALIDQEIADTRRYLRSLEGPVEQVNALGFALERLVAKFTSATSIAVTLDAPDVLAISDRLAVEVVRIVEEGLSNIRRHTVATQATVRLQQAHPWLTVAIENPDSGGSMSPPFSPKSITRRVEALGGRVSVQRDGERKTRVSVQIPL